MLTANRSAPGAVNGYPSIVFQYSNPDRAALRAFPAAAMAPSALARAFGRVRAAATGLPARYKTGGSANYSR